MVSVWTRIGRAAERIRADEDGAVESAQIFAWIVVTVIAIMATVGIMQALGVDVLCWIRDQIGIGGACP